MVAKNVRPSRPGASGTIDIVRESATTLRLRAVRHAPFGFASHQRLVSSAAKAAPPTRRVRKTARVVRIAVVVADLPTPPTVNPVPGVLPRC
jgi:hypothetical protein